MTATAPLKYALCALSFFRARHSGRPRFKKSKNITTVPNRREYVRLARHYIRKAREAGFRGSIRQQVGAA